MDPNALVGGDDAAQSQSFIDNLTNHSWFLAIAGIVMLHIIAIAWVVIALYRQTPDRPVLRKLELSKQD